MICSVAGFCTGSRVVAGSGSLSAVGSGDTSVHQDDGWLVSGLGVGVGLEMSSSVGQTEKYSPLFSSTHSTNVAKLSLVTSAGTCAFNQLLRQAW